MSYNGLRAVDSVMVSGRKPVEFWKIAYLVVSILIIGSLSSASSSMTSLTAFSLFFVGVFLDRSIPFCIYLVCSILNVSFETSLTALGSQAILLMLSFRMVSEAYAKDKKIVTILIFLFVSLLMSFITGPNSNFKQFLSIIITIMVFLSFGSFYSKSKDRLIIVSLVMVGLYVGVSTWLGFQSGSVEMLNDVKLTYRENIRTLANACAFPFVFSSCLLIHSIAINMFSRRWWLLALTLLFGFLLINSYSRGTLIAAISAVLVYTLISNKKTRLSNKIIIFLLLVVFALLAAGVDIASDTMYDDASMLARSELWAYLFNETTQSLMTIFFGLGTGNIREYLSGSVLDGYYTHSLLLDYYFCYGLFGFLSFIALLYTIFNRLMKHGQKFMIAVFVLAVLMFFSHGMSTSLLFYGLMGLCLGRINVHQNTQFL